MNDQNQPKLSLEEELDVLEAVYKVGKEKGLELLRPEQVKKLRDAGRMNFEMKRRISKKTDEELVETSFRVVGELLSLMGDYGEVITNENRERVFERVYGMSSEDMGFKIFSSLKGAQNATIA